MPEARYLHMISQLQSGASPQITMVLTGHSLGGAYATILGWLYVLNAPEFSQEVSISPPTATQRNAPSHLSRGSAAQLFPGFSGINSSLGAPASRWLSTTGIVGRFGPTP